jgi:8-hydroxy-5-deazaflavin:NADPH oxidoreductase
MASKVGIIGSGTVGKTLAGGFAKHGYAVMMGSREQGKLADWKGAKGSFAETAAFGDVVVLAVKGTVAESALALCGEKNLRGKIVIDATNPISDEAPQNGVLRFFTGINDSLMERLQKKTPEAKFVKAFNSVGAPCMVNPEFPGGPPTMFICGNDDGAKAEVRRILTKFGWETDDMGKAEAARAIEPLCMLWCIPGFAKNDWMHAFKMLRKA